MSVNDEGAREHIRMLMESMRVKIAASLPAVAESIVADAATRAPSPDEEYRELNAPSGGAPAVALAGRKSADQDGRTRFDKGDTLFIEEAILAPANIEVMDSQIRVGNVIYLQDQASFTYVNKGPSSTLTSHVLSGYFMMFEAGTAGYTVSANGDGRLVPSDVKGSSRPRTMLKSIAARGMFTPTLLEQVARAKLRTVMAEIGPGTETQT